MASQRHEKAETEGGEIPQHKVEETRVAEAGLSHGSCVQWRGHPPLPRGR